jgi:hypothetical protein
MFLLLESPLIPPPSTLYPLSPLMCCNINYMTCAIVLREQMRMGYISQRYAVVVKIDRFDSHGLTLD